MKPLHHAAVSLALTVLLHMVEGRPSWTLPARIVYGAFVGVAVDVDHIFIAFIINREAALQIIRSLDPMRLYSDFVRKDGRLHTKPKTRRYTIYSTVHLGTMILVNLSVWIYLQDLAALTIIVTSVHYLTDHLYIWRRR